MPDNDTLIQHYLEGTLTEAEAAELHALLQSQPALGEQLLQQLEMDAMLHATKPLVALPTSRPPALLPKRRFTFATLTGVAAMAACATLLLTWAWRHLAPTPDNSEEMSASVAVLTRAVNLEWDKDSMRPATGSPLAPGWLRLKSGLAQIEFYQGARVTLEGPAAFQLVSSAEAYCSAGKLSAHVPPQAKGFRIDTPKGAIVDLGTEFGLNINDGAAEVHVFDGEVELHRDQRMTSLKEGEAASLAGEGAPGIAANEAAFASLRELEVRSAESQRADFERWLAQSAKSNTDPSLLMHFDFQDAAGSRSLRNQSLAPARLPDGSIVGSAWTEGRWPGKRALEFRNVSDRVRLSLPDEVLALTLSAWVRVAGLDRAFNSLFMCEGWGDRNVHWQITRAGELRLGVANVRGKPHVDYDTPVLFTPERFGQWVHLATVFDPTAREVRHYVDGELQARLPMKAVFPLRLTTAELGNWNNDPRTERTAIRHFSGAMDEFALYSRVLSDAEIAAMSR